MYRGAEELIFRAFGTPDGGRATGGGRREEFDQLVEDEETRPCVTFFLLVPIQWMNGKKQVRCRNGECGP